MTLDKPIETDPCMTLESEDDAEFNRHVNDWIDQFRPETPFETQVIRHAAAVSWELDVASRYEKACRIERIDKAVRACVNGSRDQIEHAKARASFDPSMEGERLRRHQTSLRRELRRDLELFAKPRLQSAKQNPKQATVADEVDSNRESGIGSRESGIGGGESPLGADLPTPPLGAGLHQEDRGLTPPARQSVLGAGLPTPPKPTTAGSQQEDRGLTPPARQNPAPARQNPPSTRQFSFGVGVPTPLRPPAESALAVQLLPRSSANRKARRPDPERILREIRTGRRTKRVINLPPTAKPTEMMNVSASGPKWAVDGGSSGSHSG